MDEKCRTCTIKCRQAEHIHETALGRMYALNELLSYIKKVDRGELVEVVLCKDCDWRVYDESCKEHYCNHEYGMIGAVGENYFCYYGERKIE